MIEYYPKWDRTRILTCPLKADLLSFYDCYQVRWLVDNWKPVIKKLLGPAQTSNFASDESYADEQTDSHSLAIDSLKRQNLWQSFRLRFLIPVALCNKKSCRNLWNCPKHFVINYPSRFMTIPSHFVANSRYFLWSNMPHCQICLTQKNERQLHDQARNVAWISSDYFESLLLPQ